MPDPDQLAAIDHIVVLMLENRSFDHMLGFLYTDQGNRSPSGQPYEGLTGRESNPDTTGAQVPVFRIRPADPGAYYMPGADPGEGYQATNQQLFGTTTVTSPAPAATNQGHMDDATHTFTVPSVFGLLSGHNLDWAVYGYSAQPLTRGNFPDIYAAPASHFGLFTDFRKAAANGALPPFTFLEPDWSSTGNSQHPNYDVALGEQLIHDVYYALRQGPAWDKTLLIVTYDEHGGCYDHVPPPAAVPPDNAPGEYGYDFTRYGVRVPAILVSPLIPAATVLRVPDGTTPFDHTSVLKTVQRRWNLPPLTARDKAAPDLGAALTLTTPRTDDPLAGVTVPTATGPNPAAGETSHLLQVYRELTARHLIPATDDNGR